MPRLSFNALWVITIIVRYLGQTKKLSWWLQTMGRAILTKKDMIIHDRACAPVLIIVNGQRVVAAMSIFLKKPNERNSNYGPRG